jgi:hypothetical protein
MSRIKDENDTISQEVSEANAFKPDLAFEVHNNAGRGDGFEVFVQTNSYAAKSKAAAQAVEKQVKAIGQQSRGIKTTSFMWTSSVKAPAILTEGFFVDNWNDAKDFDTVEEQKKLATAYVKGVCAYFGVDYNVTTGGNSGSNSTTPSTPAATSYLVEATFSKSYVTEAEAKEIVSKLQALGAIASYKANTAKKELKVDSVVRLKAGAKYMNGKIPKDFVYNRDHTVYSISGDRVVIDYNGAIVGPVHRNDLILV